MIGLFDLDSLLYQILYKIISIGEIKFMYQTGSNRSDIEKYIIDKGYEDVLKKSMDILNTIEDSGIYFFEVEYFLTECPQSFRKRINVDYKKNRKSNKWVKLLRKRFVESGIAQVHPEYEADDLIAKRASELSEYVIISVDKDLQQIPGLHFDYYSIKDENGKFLEYRGLKHFSEFESNKFLAKQMLSGDSTDCIPGVPQIGKVKAEKILEKCDSERQLVIAVYRQYYKRHLIDPDYEYFSMMALNYRMLKLGIC